MKPAKKPAPKSKKSPIPAESMAIHKSGVNMHKAIAMTGIKKPAKKK